MSNRAFSAGMLGILCLALFLRVPRLGLRPMHHDEANQALKFGALLELGEYRYDPTDHHGPSLYYLSLPFAWAAGAAGLEDLNEAALRRVPVAFSLALLLLLALIGKELGRPGVLGAALLWAASPAVVYYSRFYIQESLFLFFVLGTMIWGWRYLSRPTPAGAAVCGWSAGMTFATKETCVIVFAALLGAALLVRLGSRGNRPEFGSERRMTGMHLGVFIGSAGAVAVALYSSFFRHLPGVADSVRSYFTYLERAGEPSWHAHPWFYYLKLLAFSRYGRGPVWSEALVLGLALVGIVSAFRPGRREPIKSFVRFVLFYTLISTFIFSLISYKTPWNLLPFYLGVVILAGAGAAYLIERAPRPGGKAVVAVLLAAGAFHLAWQSQRSNVHYYADPRNPYVYSHTSTDFMRMVRRIQDLASLHPRGRDLLIKVVADPYSTWPLPWYLRSFSHVGYWQEAAEAGAFAGAPLVVASPEQLARLSPELGDDYQIEYYGLRPEVLVALCIEDSLWEAFLKTRKGTLPKVPP
jgi:uncharacterized protein (TIGR03663 family)